MDGKKSFIFYIFGRNGKESVFFDLVLLAKTEEDLIEYTNDFLKGDKR